MNNSARAFIIAIQLLLTFRLGAATLYVDGNNPSPAPPYASWSTAATNIQDAIDVATDGDLVLVTNGVYSAGGKVMAGDLTNRVVIDKAITVQSVNGAPVTTIEGRRDFANVPVTISIRCVWMTNGAVLSGFTLREGQTRSSGDADTLRCGGGVWCATTNALITNSVIQGCAATLFGGGSYRGTLKNCLISGNTASSGGGAASSILFNSALVANFASVQGGGAYQAALTNCTVSKNSAGASAGATHSTYLYNSVVWGNVSPLPVITIVASTPPTYSCLQTATGGAGNLYVDPQLLADGYHLAADSPCRTTGNAAYISGVDLDGQAWDAAPAMGCDQSRAEPWAGAAEAKPVGGGRVQLTVMPTGQEPIACWWLKDGMLVLNDSRHTGATTTNLMIFGFGPSDAGHYQTVVSNVFGVTTSLVTRVTVRCVDAAAVMPGWPYATWATAASSIQDAIEASAAGDFVLVTNGVYASGGKVMSGDLTNRVVLDRVVTVLSVNGPNVTFIEGQKDPVSTNGPAAIRAAWVADGARLEGFTVRNGATRAAGNQTHLLSGGGIWASSTNALVANCIVLSNAAGYGGGAFGATLERCTVRGNSAWYGGGCYSNRINGCLVSENRAEVNGGGTSDSSVYNSAITKNVAGSTGGGIHGAVARNCTVTFNRANVGGGIYPSSGSMSFTNLIVWANVAVSLPNYNSSAAFRYSCSSPLPVGTGNIASDPLLLDDGIHIATNSPCRGAGAPATTGVDIDDQSWSNPPSMGCDEGSPFPVVTTPRWQLDTVGMIRLTATGLGQTPISYQWLRNGAALNDSGRMSGSTSAELRIGSPIADDAGEYHLVVSNIFGVRTSQVLQLTLRFVDQHSTSAIPPYVAWQSAATNIQDAVEVSAPGDVIVVASGIYGLGGKVMAGDLTNRVALDRPVGLLSQSGPLATIIQGAWDVATTNGPGAVRGVWMSEGATLCGFTVRGGGVRNSGGPVIDLQTGGGIWCAATNATVFNCIVRGNAAGFSSGGGAGGVFRGTLVNSLIRDNFTAAWGAGVASNVLINCTITENWGLGSQTAAVGCRVYNSIIWGNYYSGGLPPVIEYTGGTFTNSCTRPLPAGAGNIAANPLLMPDGWHLRPESPCVDAGGSVASVTDLDGQARTGIPDIGCDERAFELASVTPLLRLPGNGRVRLRLDSSGATPDSVQWFKDGVPLGDDARITGSSSTELSIAEFQEGDIGSYHAVATNLSGVATSSALRVQARFVDLNNGNPVAPYTNWVTAANTIQSAIDAAAFGELIVVADGDSRSGGRVVSGDLTNRLVLTKAVQITSRNGYTNAFITGARDVSGTNGPSAVRAVWMDVGTTLAGFTVRDGATRASGDLPTLQSGGGVWGVNAGATVVGCLLTNNLATSRGGGACGVSLDDCLVLGNSALMGGGVYGAVVNRSRLIDNMAWNTSGHGGGGANASTLRNSLLHKNRAVFSLGGGGAYNCTVYNCTVTENVGDGVGWGSAYNSIFWGNTPRNYSGSPSINHSLAAPGNLSYGTNNLYTDPLLVDAFHLTAASPARNAGGPLFVSGADLDGEVWGSPASIGADEFNTAASSGPLIVVLELSTNHVLQNREVVLIGRVTGRAARVEWDFGDGTVATNRSYLTRYVWGTPGMYPVTFRAFNEDYPAGVAVNVAVTVLPVTAPEWISLRKLSTPPYFAYQLEFQTQLGVTNLVEYATNLAPPIAWMPFTTNVSTNAIMKVINYDPPEPARFYRILAR